jgi:hypothetical protein
MEKYNTLKNKKDYEDFILEIPNELIKISHMIGKVDLGYDEEEIREISKIFIDLKNDNLFDITLKRTLITYFGEVFKLHFGGEWDFTGLKSDSWAINEPVITKFKNEGMRMSPSEWIWGLFENNNPNKFNESIHYKKDFDKKTDDVFAQLFPKKKKK